MINEVLPRLEDTGLAVSATTRLRRQHEENGRDYHFLTDDEFDRSIADGDFIEHVHYDSHRYGTLKSEVEGELRAGRNVILEIELEGARKVRRQIPGAILIFIAPPSPEELRRRLEGRETEASADIEARLARAGEELASQDEFDYIVVNRTVAEAADELEKVINHSLKGG